MKIRAPGKGPRPAPAFEAVAVFLVPCSCGLNIAVAGSDPKRGSWGRQLQCPQCGKKHDRHFRAVRFEYGAGYWASKGC